MPKAPFLKNNNNKKHVLLSRLLTKFPNYLYQSGKTFVIFKDLQITLLLLLNIDKGYFTRFLLFFSLQLKLRDRLFTPLRKRRKKKKLTFDGNVLLFLKQSAR